MKEPLFLMFCSIKLKQKVSEKSDYLTIQVYQKIIVNGGRVADKSLQKTIEARDKKNKSLGRHKLLKVSRWAVKFYLKADL